MKRFQQWFLDTAIWLHLIDVQHLEAMLKKAYNQGKAQAKQLERAQKEQFCREIWDLYTRASVEKSEMKKTKMLDDFLNNL